MERASTVEAVRAAVGRARGAGRRIGFVPTMGALHEGHLSLIRLVREHADFIVLSVFVNPTQFGPREDLEAYPRTLEEDARTGRDAGADLLFAPPVEEMYPPGFSTTIRVPGLSGPLCGARRPGHFDGVALVVAKLLNIVQPDVSVFGQKDAQQALLIQRLAADLHLPGRILVGPTVRDEDGLALSSRNRYLNAEERAAALALSRGLSAAARAWDEGERSAAELVRRARTELESEPLVEPEYAEIRRLSDLGAWSGGTGGALLAVSARVGPARLIDNIILEAEDGSSRFLTRPGDAGERE